MNTKVTVSERIKLIVTVHMSTYKGHLTVWPGPNSIPRKYLVAMKAMYAWYTESDIADSNISKRNIVEWLSEYRKYFSHSLFTISSYA
jgi:hypothetical protein